MAFTRAGSVPLPAMSRLPVLAGGDGRDGRAALRFFAAEGFLLIPGTEKKYHENCGDPKNYASTRTPFQKATWSLICDAAGFGLG